VQYDMVESLINSVFSTVLYYQSSFNV